MELLNELEHSKQRLEEEVDKVTAAFEREEKLRKELEALNTKLLAEKTQLLQSLEGEKGSLSSIQERAAKLAAQKSDLDSQLSVSVSITFLNRILRFGYRNPACFVLMRIQSRFNNLLRTPIDKPCRYYKILKRNRTYSNDSWRFILIRSEFVGKCNRSNYLNKIVGIF